MADAMTARDRFRALMAERRRLPGGRGDKLKRKIGGGVVPRHEE